MQTANCNLLLDHDQDGNLGTQAGGYAFHEHNGHGMNGLQIASLFTNFWFDDNWLARLCY